MDATPYVSRMWVDLQRANRLPKGNVLSSCEDELQELMRQIDIMVQNRKMDWDKDRHTLKAKLDVREQEFMIQKTTLEQKHQEIGQLRSRIESMESVQREKSMDYEKQLSGLRNQVGNIKKDYDKLQRRYRHMKDRDKSKQASIELEDNAAEVRRLNDKIEEYRQKTREWEHQKRSYEKQLDSLESQKQTLVEKCEFVQSQTTTYQSQLDKRKDMLDSTELALKAQITQLESQLDRARDTVNSQETQISRLKASNEEYVTSQKQNIEEREQMEKELRKAQTTAKNLETEMQQSHVVLRARSDILGQTQDEHTQMKKTLIQMEEQLRQKDNTIRSMESISRSETSDQVKRLHEEMQAIKSDLRNSKRSEKTMQEDLNKTRNRLDDARQECGHLSADLATKISEIRSLEKNDIRNYRAEVSKLKKELAHRQEAHTDDMDSFKRDMGSLKDELLSKNTSIASLSEKLSLLETQVREHNELLERKVAELQVANAQLEALRLENRHLRRTTLSKMAGCNDESMTDGDIADAEKHLRELQSAYTSSVSSLEQQNEQLQKDITSLRDELNSVEDNTQIKVQKAIKESQKRIERIKVEEQKKVQEAKASGDRKVQTLRDKLDATVAEYESQIENMQLEMSQMEDDLNNQSQSFNRLGLENDVMSNFVDGVDNIVNCPPKRENSILSNPDNSSHSHSRPLSSSSALSRSSALNHDYEDEDEDFLVDSADVATANFMAEQQQRTIELEKKLDMHIQGLKVATEATVRKYTGR